MSAISWLPHLERACLEATVVPVAGGLPPFPEQELLEALRQRLQLPSLGWTLEVPKTLTDQEGEEFSARELQREGQLTLVLSAPPLEGCVALSLMEEDLWELLSLSGGAPVEALREAPDHELGRGFLLYALLQGLQVLREQDWPPQSSWHVQEGWSGRPRMVQPLLLRLEEHSWPISVTISEELLESCRKSFAPRPLEHLNQELAYSIRVAVDVGMGRVELPMRHLRAMRPGDLLLLDQWLAPPTLAEGEVVLRVGREAIWSCAVASGQLTAKDPFPPTLQESPMTVPPNSKTDDFDWEAELDAIPDFDESVEERRLSLDEGEGEAPPSAEAEEEEAEEEAVAAPVAKAEEGQPSPTRARRPRPSGSAPMRPAERLDEVRVQVTVSLGRFGMSMRELMEVRPGAALTLPIGTDGQVELLVGDRRIGRGELVQVEDLVGVRVLEI